MRSSFLMGMVVKTSLLFGLVSTSFANSNNQRLEVENVELTVSSIEVLLDDRTEVLSQNIRTFNLSELNSEVRKALQESSIDQGEITQIKFGFDFAIATLNDGTTHDINDSKDIRLHVEPGINVVTGNISNDLILDMDTTKLAKVKGNAKNFNGIILKSEVEAVNTSSKGTISGSVVSNNCTVDDKSDDFGDESGLIQVYQDGNLVAQQTTWDFGKFSISGLAPGVYEVKASRVQHNDFEFSSEVYVANETNVGDITLAGKCVVFKGRVTGDENTEDTSDDIPLQVSFLLRESYQIQGQMVETDSDGYFETKPLFAAVYEMSFSGIDSYEDQTINLEKTEGEIELDIILKNNTPIVTQAELDARALLKEVQASYVKIHAQVGVDGRLFGSITNLQLSNALRNLGFDIDRKNIRIIDDRIRSIGTYEAELSLHRNVKGRFLFEVVGE